MSSLWIPTEPARAGLTAAPLETRPADPAIAATLASIADASESEVLALDARGRFFRVRGAGTDLFVKLETADRLGRHLDADEIAGFVAAKGVAVSRMLPLSVRLLPDGRFSIPSRWIEGSPPVANADDLGRLGTAIGRLHGVLERLPDADAVRREGENRRAMLLQEAEAVAAGTPAGPLPDLLADAVRGQPNAFASEAPDSRCVHGDLNPGNVLMTKAGPVFLDFEDAVGAWLPVAHDLAFPIERLILLDQPDEDAADLAETFLSGYEAGGGRIPDTAGWLDHELQRMTLRSLLLLHSFERTGTPWPRSEWEKFATLTRTRRERSDLIRRIERRGDAS